MRFAYFKTANIYGFLQICFWLFHGKNYLKQKLAEEYLKDFEVENLPFSRVTEELELDHFNNKFIVSGSHQSIVDKINQNLKIGNKAFGSGLNGNLVGERKAKFIMDKFGPDFAYVGNSMADIPIWKKAHTAYAYNASTATIKSAKRHGVKFEKVVLRSNYFTDVIIGMRIHQWVKNLLLLVPAILNVNFLSLAGYFRYSLRFLGFSFVASSTYLINDLLDVLRIDSTLLRKIGLSLVEQFLF